MSLAENVLGASAGDAASRKQADIAERQRSGGRAVPAAQSGSERLGAVAELDTTQVIAPPLVLKKRLNRRNAWARRAQSSEFLRPLSRKKENGFWQPPRPGSCSWTLGSGVGIMAGESSARFTGLERCSSIWACPCCAPVIRSQRAAEVQTAVEQHQAQGGQLLFFTGTVRHRKTDSLDTTLGGLLGAWAALVKTGAWKRKKEKFGISGYVRAVEITYGAHGWHPHIHVLLFIDRTDISEAEIEAFQAWLYGYWCEAVEKAGARKPTEKGLDVQKVDTKGKVLARYVAKIQQEKSWSVGAEMTRVDAKRGREGSLIPFELLDKNSEIDEKKRAILWREFYTITKSKRAIIWSRGLKKRFSIGEIEDENIVESIVETLVWRTSAKDFRSLAKQGASLPAIALEHVEKGELEKVALLLPKNNETIVENSS